MTDKRCERCGKRHLADWVWLELGMVTGTYHEPGSVAPDRSQGIFPFGRACAKAAQAGKKRRMSIAYD